MNTIVNKALRLSIGAFWTSSIPRLVEETWASTLQERQNYFALKYYVKIAEDQTHLNYFKTFHSYFDNQYTSIKPFGYRARDLMTTLSINLSDIAEIKTQLKSYQMISNQKTPAYRKSRRKEVILAWIWISYIVYTHHSLFMEKSLTNCSKCDPEFITVQHILNSCELYKGLRKNIFGPNFEYMQIYEVDENLCRKLFLLLSKADLYNLFWTLFFFYC